jgi:D-sedoheptulose 7-phosphate isomerase
MTHSRNRIEAILLRSLDEHKAMLDSLGASHIQQIIEIAGHMTKVLLGNGTIYWCGNGGSAADCQHLAAELVGRFNLERRPLRSVALSADTSVLTCIANDYSFSDVFSRQINALADKGDVLIGVSTSGESPNVVNALKAAKQKGLYTIGLLGGDGGTVLPLADSSILVPSRSTARIQEAHILIGHCLCEIIESSLCIG